MQNRLPCAVSQDTARYVRELAQNLAEQERQELVWAALDDVLEAILKAKEAGLGTADKFKWLDGKLESARDEIKEYLEVDDGI